MAWAIPDDKRNCTFPFETSIPFKKIRPPRKIVSFRWLYVD